MSPVNLKYVMPQVGRDGRVHYWYFRRNGRYWRLPGAPGSPEFMAAYTTLLGETAVQRSPKRSQGHPAGSMGALVTEYYGSPAFQNLKPASQRVYRMVLDELRAKAGDNPVALLERRHIIAGHERRASTPAMANLWARVMQVLMAFAVDRGYRRDNPALRIKAYRIGTHRAWTPDELARFEQHWPQGSMQRRAYALALYTGQRRGDLANMTKANRRGGEIKVTQEKTGAEVFIPEHPDLTAELARGDQHISLLVDAAGAAFSKQQLGRWFADAIHDAGLPDDCVLHGLRKTAAKTLAEAGCTAHEIMAITGHKSLTEVQRYCDAARQKVSAKAAILKLQNAPRDIGRTEDC